MPETAPGGSWFTCLLRERSVQIALGLWIACVVAIFPLSGGTLPFNRPVMAGWSAPAQVVASMATMVIIFLLMGVTYFLTLRRAVPDMASRAPEIAIARRETLWLWLYAAVVMVIGQIVGRRMFGEGIGMHLNGSLFGATRTQSPQEVWTWAIFNFVLFAVVPYAVFRARGYSREALNLKSANLRNDALVIVVILAIISAGDLATGGLLKLHRHQILEGGALSLVVHLLGTGLPVMVFIYAILMPRYMKLAGSASTAVLLGGVSYGALHLFEYWTAYDSVSHSILSVIFVFLTFVPPGLMKSFMTLRSGNAWVHLWGFHAISPHVTGDATIIIRDFGID
jgi:hypothetical protein